MNIHQVVCIECGNEWQCAIADDANGTTAPCPHCYSVMGSFHVCCDEDESEDGKERD